MVSRMADDGRGPMLRVSDVAERLNVTPRYIWRLISEGRLTAVKLGPRCTRVAESEVARFLSTNGGVA